MSRLRRLVLLLSFLGIVLTHGLTVSIVAPVLSLEAADNRGLSTTVIGAVVGADDVAIFVVSLVVAYFATLANAVVLFVSGALASAWASFMFSKSARIQDDNWFMVVSFILRIVQGSGFALSWTAGLPYMVNLNQGREALVSGMAEFCVVIGVVAGPTIGMNLYALFGYEFVFLIPTVFVLLFIILFLIVKETADIHGEVEKVSLSTLLQFYFSVPVQIITMQMLSASTFIGYCETILTIHFHDEMELEMSETGGMWTVLGLSYLIMVPFAMYLTERKCFAILPVAGSVLALSLLLLSVPQFVKSLRGDTHFEMIYLFLSGGSSVSSLVPMFVVLSLFAKQQGISNNGALVSGVINAVFALGGILGPVIFGGVLYEEYGYRYSGLCLALFVIFSTIMTASLLQTTGILTGLCCSDTKGDSETSPINAESPMKSSTEN